MLWARRSKGAAASAQSRSPIVALQRTPSRKWYWYCHGVWQAPSDEWGQWAVREADVHVLQYFQSYSLTEPSELRTEGSASPELLARLAHVADAHAAVGGREAAVRARVRVLVRVVEVRVSSYSPSLALALDVPVHVDGAHAGGVVVHDGRREGSISAASAPFVTSVPDCCRQRLASRGRSRPSPKPTPCRCARRLAGAEARVLAVAARSP